MLNKKKFNYKNKKLFLLVLISVFLTSFWLIPPTKSVQVNLNTEIESFKDIINDSLDDCWRKPAENRKRTMLNKIIALENLILDENIEEAYDKLLHDIKPKLTGLKTDENGIPWANGIYKNPWVRSEDLRDEFRVICNILLMRLSPLYFYDDDTPPVIDISHEGGYTTDDPGYWIVDIEDLESGLKEVEILVEGVIEVDENNLNGIISATYTINVPAEEGVKTITITAINNDYSPDSSFLSSAMDVQPPNGHEDPGDIPIIIG